MNQAYGLPGLVQQVFITMSLFVGDMNFSHPGCTGLNSFSAIYAVNVAGMKLDIMGHAILNVFQRLF